MPGVKFKITSSEIIGNPNSYSWIRAVVEKENVVGKGNLFFLIKINDLNQENTDLTFRGNVKADQLREEFLRNERESFDAIKKLLDNNLQLSENENLNSEFCLGTLVNDILYVGATANYQVLLLRNKNIVSLIDGAHSNKIISGHIKDKDILIVLTKNILNILSEAQLYKLLVNNNSLQEIEDSLSTQILSLEDNADCGCLIINFQKDESSEEVTEKNFDSEISEEENETETKKNHPLKNIQEKLVNLKYLLKRKLFLEDGVEFSFQKNKKKPALIIAFVLIVILASSMFFGVKKKEEAKIYANFENVYTESKNKYEEGFAILELNNTQAKNFLNEAKDKLNVSLAQIPDKKSLSYQKGQALLLKINDSLSSVGGVHKISSPETFYDLTLIKDGAAGTSISLYKKNLLILDSKNNNLYQLSLDSKSAVTLANQKDIEGVKFISSSKDSYFYFKDNSGVNEISDSTKKNKNVIKKEKEIGEVGGISAFGGNVYLLDKTNKQITKFVGLDNGYSSGKNYLAKDIAPDFSQSIQLIIDGAVWVLNRDNSIVKFIQGRADSFNPTGIDPKLSQVTRIFTSEDTKFIYLLEPVQKRVVVLDKTGVFQAQYVWDGIKDATDLAVLEDQKKLLILMSSKIYSITLK